VKIATAEEIILARPSFEPTPATVREGGRALEWAILGDSELPADLRQARLAAIRESNPAPLLDRSLASSSAFRSWLYLAETFEGCSGDISRTAALALEDSVVPSTWGANGDVSSLLRLLLAAPQGCSGYGRRCWLEVSLQPCQFAPLLQLVSV